MTRVTLRAGHVQPVWAGHPWIFAQGVGETQGTLEHGGEVEVLDARGHSLGRGFASKGSAIAIRLFTRNADEHFDRSFVEGRLRRALSRRAALGLPDRRPDRETTGFRCFYGEGDGIPGLVLDLYDDVVVLQVGSAGVARRREIVLDAIENVLRPRAILDRTSEKSARAERFEFVPGLVRGELPEALVFHERGLAYHLPLSLAQKTGYYFDQRPLRDRVEELAAGRNVLDVYSYVGAIGLAAKRGGAGRVVSVDSSKTAIEIGRQLAQTNGLDVEFEESDASRFLEAQKPEWDLVVCDPPKFAQSRAGRDKAASAFRRVSGLGLAAVRPGGLLVLSSCSAALGAREIERSLALAARDRNREATVIERIFQGVDHPVPPAFPEGLYLSTVIAVVD